MASASSTENPDVDEPMADVAETPPAGTDPSPENDPGRPNRWLVFALTLLAGVVMFLAAISTWVDRQALDTDNWVDASDALLADDDIRDALSRYIVDEIYANVDVAAQLEERLPSALDRLAGPAAAALRGPATDAVDRLLGTDQVRAVWERVNLEAHAALVRVLEDETRPGVSTADGTITIQLGEVIRTVGTRLGLPDSVIDRIPEDAGTVTVIESDRLAAAQDAVKTIKWASVLLFFVVVALFVAAVALARGWRAIALRNVGITGLVVGLLLLVVQRVGRNYILNNFVEVRENRKAAAAVLAIGTELLRDIAWNIVAVGLVVALAGALLGSSRAAVRIRRFIAPAMTASPAIVWGVAGVVFFLFVLWGPLPVLETWYGLLLAAVLLALLVEALRRRCMDDAADEGSPPEPASPEPDDADPTDTAEPAEAGAPGSSTT